MTAMTGSAGIQSDLWTERSSDWADVMEGWNGWGIPVYRHVLDHMTVDHNSVLLDVGCGAGRFCRVAADRGARVAGLDATPAFVEIARERVHDGDFRVGDMEDLPWVDDSFDVVTGFNSFFIAADMVGALGEARRVTRPGGHVAMTVFGRPDRCQSTELFAIIGPLMGAGKGQPPKGRGLHEEGVLEDRAIDAGLTPQSAGYLQFDEAYPNLETMLRGYLAAPPFVRAARAAGAGAVRDALTEALRPLEGPDGRYRLTEEIRYLVATA